jgi:hypothetical protein
MHTLCSALLGIDPFNWHGQRTESWFIIFVEICPIQTASTALQLISLQFGWRLLLAYNFHMWTSVKGHTAAAAAAVAVVCVWVCMWSGPLYCMWCTFVRSFRSSLRSCTLLLCNLIGHHPIGITVRLVPCVVWCHGRCPVWFITGCCSHAYTTYTACMHNARQWHRRVHWRVHARTSTKQWHARRLHVYSIL